MIYRLRLLVVMASLLAFINPAQAQASGTLAPTGTMSRARACHTATLMTDGRVLMAGGIAGDGRVNADAEIYDPATGKFIDVGDMMRPRACHGGAALPNGLVLLMGGVNRHGRISTAEIFDPTTNTFSYIGEMNSIRSGFTATTLKDGRVLITGGYGLEILSSAEIFDPATFTFTPIESMTIPRYNHTATLLNDGRVLIVGGQVRSRGRNQIFATAEIFDPITESFSSTGSMSHPRHKHAAALLPSGNVLIVGGSNEQDFNGRFATAEVYDVAKGAFFPIGNMASVRYKNAEAVVTLPNGGTLITGGTPIIEVFNAETNTFTIANQTLDTDRYYGTATLLSDGSVLIAGGYDTNIESTKQAWIYKP